MKDCWAIVPAFNEEREVGGVLDRLLALGCQVALVDDGSVDGTLAEGLKRPVHVLRHVVNLGQGAALRTGIEYALLHGARHLVTFDADAQHRAPDVAPLLAPVLRGECQIALGTRFRRPAAVSKMPALRRWILRSAAWYVRTRFGIGITDTHNGLRAMTAEAARAIRFTHNGMAHASEILEIIARKKIPFREVDVAIEYTEYSLSKGQKISNSLNILWERLLHKVR